MPTIKTVGVVTKPNAPAAADRIDDLVVDRLEVVLKGGGNAGDALAQFDKLAGQFVGNVAG